MYFHLSFHSPISRKIIFWHTYIFYVNIFDTLTFQLMTTSSASSQQHVLSFDISFPHFMKIHYFSLNHIFYINISNVLNFHFLISMVCYSMSSGRTIDYLIYHFPTIQFLCILYLKLTCKYL